MASQPKGKGVPGVALPLLPLKLHPLRPGTAVWAVGPYLFAYDTVAGKWEQRRREIHSEPIRALDVAPVSEAGDPQAATRWASGGDDKRLVLWDEQGGLWHSAGTLTHPKKITALLFDSSRSVVFADRFGDVLLWDCTASGAEPRLLLSHLAIVTAMAFAGAGQFLVTGDNHEKIRVSYYPDCFEIHSFCLGHAGQITALAPWGEAAFLSASADETLRLWHFDGTAMAESDLGAAVTGLSCCFSQELVLVGCEGSSGLRLVRVRGAAGDQPTLVVEASGEALSQAEAPQALCFGRAEPADPCLWVDRRGHLRIVHRGPGRPADIFAGDDLPPSHVNLSKNANWDETAAGDGEEAEGAATSKKRRRQLLKKAGAAEEQQDEEPKDDAMAEG